jgi:peroxiredoxin
MPGASPPDSAEVGIAVGDRAPDFVRDSGAPALIGLDQQPVRLTDFAGHPLWIVFWATWCTPCQEEAPDIEAESRAHADAGLSVLAIDVQDPESSVREFMAQHGVEYTVALDSTAAVQNRFGGWALPVHYFIDAQGVIRDRYIGQLSRAGMEQHLGSILGLGRSVPLR